MVPGKVEKRLNDPALDHEISQVWPIAGNVSQSPHGLKEKRLFKDLRLSKFKTDTYIFLVHSSRVPINRVIKVNGVCNYKNAVPLRSSQ